ncbi:MAG TPA: dTDP-4-dehydrorhamnose 3,5-epimerase [Actinomycetes bacterium]|nr:dTDP-4-dehydrorhamnose 3,5-epimerase [Actinomycetes bacterium]
MAEVTESEQIPGVWVVRPDVLEDERGRFMETWRSSWLPFSAPMVQGNRSGSRARVLRGLHYHRRQADLWFVQAGRVTTVLLDTRVGSPAQGRHTTLQQGGGEEVAVYIPEGVAHGFYAHDDVVMSYLVTNEYDGSDELGVAWDDPELGIDWPDPAPILSGRDRRNPRLAEVPAGDRVAWRP